MEKVIFLIDTNKALSDKLLEINKNLHSTKEKLQISQENLSEISNFFHQLQISENQLKSESKKLEICLDSLLEQKNGLTSMNSELLERMMKLSEEKINKLNEMYELENVLKMRNNKILELETATKIQENNSEKESVFEAVYRKSVKAPRKKTFFFPGHEVEGTMIVYNSSGSSLFSAGNEKVIKG